MNGYNEEHDLVGAYVLDALSTEEQDTFFAHLARCEMCQLEVAQLRTVVDILPLAVEAVEPSRELRARIMSQLDESADEAKPHLTSIAGGAAARPRRFITRATGTLYASAAAVVIAGLGVWNYQLQDRVHSLQSADAFRQDVTVALASGATVSSIHGTRMAPSSSAAVVQPAGRRAAYLIVRGLSPSSSGKLYQLWFIRNGVPTSAGTFNVSGNAPQIVPLPASSKGFQQSAVTVEPGPHGSPSPTGETVLAGNLGL